MLYAIVAMDAPGSGERRAQARPAHMERLREMQAHGRVVLAGPFPKIDAPSTEGGVDGSLIVVEFPTLQEAQAWIDADPYTTGGVYTDIEVRPFIRVFPQ